MVLLSESQLQSLLDAVPSFQQPWRDHEASAKDCEERFGDAPRTQEERSDDFLWHLARHLGIATPAAAKSVRITRGTKNGQFLTVLHGPDPKRPVDSIFSDARPDIIIHNRCLFYLQKTPALSAALRNALRQGKSPT